MTVDKKTLTFVDLNATQVDEIVELCEACMTKGTVDWDNVYVKEWFEVSQNNDTLHPIVVYSMNMVPKMLLSVVRYFTGKK